MKDGAREYRERNRPGLPGRVKGAAMIVVAGGTGFVGSAIARELVRRGVDVAVMSHRSRSAMLQIGAKAVEVRRGDVADPASLAAALAGAETVVGAVQFKGFPNENQRKGLTFVEVDQRGTERLIAAARDAGVRRYVYLSGVGAAPDARQVWFRAKWGAETAVRAAGLQALIVRPSWVYGAGDASLNRYVAFVKSPLPFVPVIGDGQQRLQPVYVEDVARLVADSLTGSGPAEGVFEIGGPAVLTMDQVIRTVESVTGRRKPLLHQPVWLMKALFAPKALLPALPLPLSPSGLEFATLDALADNTALLAARSDFRLTPLREGLETYLDGRPTANAAN